MPDHIISAISAAIIDLCFSRRKWSHYSTFNLVVVRWFHVGCQTSVSRLVARTFASCSKVRVGSTFSPARAVPSIAQGHRGRSRPALPGFAPAPCASPSAPQPQPPAPQPPPTLTQQLPPMPAPPSPPSPAHQPCPAPSPRKHQHCLPPVPSVCNFLPSCTGGSSCGWDSLDAERPPQMGGSRYTARRHTTHPLHTPTPRLGRATML